MRYKNKSYLIWIYFENHELHSLDENSCAKNRVCKLPKLAALQTAFTLTEIETDTVTNKKWLLCDCVEVFLLLLHRDTYAIRYCNHCINLWLGIGLGVCYCERTINVPSSKKVFSAFLYRELKFWWNCRNLNRYMYLII